MKFHSFLAICQRTNATHSSRPERSCSDIPSSEKLPESGQEEWKEVHPDWISVTGGRISHIIVCGGGVWIPSCLGRRMSKVTIFAFIKITEPFCSARTAVAAAGWSVSGAAVVSLL